MLDNFQEHYISIVVSFVGTLLFIYFCRDFSISVGLVDKINWRKKHKGNVPLIGGLAIVFGFLLGCLLSPRSMNEWRPLFFCIVPLIVVGVIDDYGELPVAKRVFAQITTCFIMIYYGDVYLINFGKLFGNWVVTFTGLETIITIICVVGVINALNLIDGIDGLCGAMYFVASISIITIVKLKDSSASLSLLIYFSASTFAYLIVNIGLTKKFIGKIFLGDTGTTIIGFFLCWYLIKFSSEENMVFKPITAVWFLAVPIIDTITVMLRRLKNKTSPFSAGRDHIHHLLMSLGFSPLATLTTIFFFSLILSIIGITAELNQIPEYYLSIGIIIIMLLYFYLTEFFWKRCKITR